MMNSENQKIRILTDSEAMSRAAAATIVDHISQSLQTRDVYSMALSVFNHAAQILFLVGGEDKADTLKAVLEGDSKTTRFPVQLIQPTHGEVTWFLDHSAASRLKPAD
jgi:6-phosphogluconolactonase/glucosamine-6-phosphate isomerase/deaminase